ncbi:RNA polymerase sigma factor [[Pseudomonas] boreopolis]|uniref:RNA polymerase sigma factor n=1 Tax=Xanthomonas boreopolis TaxID=86183 RepID=UPI003D4C0D91
MNAQTLDLMLQRDLPIARGGCPQAYGRIVAACQNTVTAIALAITRDVQASEDIAQEAFLRAWQQLSRLNNTASFMPWLRQITRNLARDWLRAHRHRPMSGEAAEIAIGMAADPGPSPADRLLRIEEETVAADIISALPEDSREALLLYYREGQRSQQVADLLGLSDAAVRKRLSRARAMVREELLQRFGRFACGSAPGVAFGQALALAVATAKPPLGLGVEAVGAGLGAGLAAKSLLGTGTASGTAVLGGLLGGIAGSGIVFWLCSRLLFSYTETEQERLQVWRAYRRYMVHAAIAVAAAAAIGLLTHGPWPLALALLAGLVVLNYDLIVTVPRVMAPLLARDAARAPQTAGRRQLVYRLNFGTSGLIVSNIGVVLMALPLILNRAV